MAPHEDRFDRLSNSAGNRIGIDQPPCDIQGSGSDSKITGREFLVTTGVLSAGMAVGMPAHPGQAVVDRTHEGTSNHMNDVELTINGQSHKFSLDPRVTLLDLLRERIGLTCTKKGCDHGQCGACTVLANGRRINSCLPQAVAYHGDSIVTVEGLGSGGKLHPVQTAFLEYDGFQCGYCTPGQICSAVALLEEAKKGDASIVTRDLTQVAVIHLTPEEIRERMSGNICRCGAYPGIVEAIQACGTD